MQSDRGNEEGQVGGQGGTEKKREKMVRGTEDEGGMTEDDVRVKQRDLDWEMQSGRRTEKRRVGGRGKKKQRKKMERGNGDERGKAEQCEGCKAIGDRRKGG